MRDRASERAERASEREQRESESRVSARERERFPGK